MHFIAPAVQRDRLDHLGLHRGERRDDAGRVHELLPEGEEPGDHDAEPGRLDDLRLLPPAQQAAGAHGDAAVRTRAQSVQAQGDHLFNDILSFICLKNIYLFNRLAYKFIGAFCM